MNEAKGLVVWLQTGLENSSGGEHSLFADKIGNKHFSPEQVKSQLTDR